VSGCGSVRCSFLTRCCSVALCRRREIGKKLFDQNKPASAFKQYEKVCFARVTGRHRSSPSSMLMCVGVDSAAKYYASGVASRYGKGEICDRASESGQLLCVRQTLWALAPALCANVWVCLPACSCKMKTKEYAECITYCSKVLAADPDNLKCVYRRASAYYFRSDWEDAFRELTRARQMCEGVLPVASAERAKELNATIATIDKRLAHVRSGRSALAQAEQRKYSGFFNDKRAGNLGLYDDKPMAAPVPPPPGAGFIRRALNSMWSNVRYVFTGGCCRRKPASKSQ
jgi:hypothetical protein